MKGEVSLGKRSPNFGEPLMRTNALFRAVMVLAWQVFRICAPQPFGERSVESEKSSPGRLSARLGTEPAPPLMPLSQKSPQAAANDEMFARYPGRIV
jgi:hypothetical protein